MLQWTPEMEQTLLSAIIKYKPIGIHKHFRLVNIIKHLANNSGIQVSLSAILEKLNDYYNLEAIEADNVIADIPESEFSLPDADFESIIEEYRQATEEDASRDTSPIRTTKKELLSSSSVKRRTRSTRDLPKRKKK